MQVRGKKEDPGMLDMGTYEVVYAEKDGRTRQEAFRVQEFCFRE